MTCLIHAAGATTDHGGDLFSGGFSWGTFLLVIGMFLALAIVSSLGFLARMRDRSVERRQVARPPVDGGSAPAG